ncbi:MULTISPECIES: hypothetical protein [Exiguobacterium]|nr:MULTISPECIES: hypothetical protein [Exiguobacterium]MCT4779969.1 hypothetical protein [Exiguobacterium soli]
MEERPSVSEWLSAQELLFEQILLIEVIPTNLSALHCDCSLT